MQLLLFVIDSSCCKEAIHFAVLSHLLFYYFHIDKRLTWSWQLYNDKIVPQKIPLEFDQRSLLSFAADLEKYSSSTRPEISFVTVLTSALLDLKWEWNSVTARNYGAVLSPPQLEKQKCRLDYKIRNHVFLITNLSDLSHHETIDQFKELMLENDGKMPLLRTALIEKRTSLSILDTASDPINNVI